MTCKEANDEEKVKTVKVYKMQCLHGISINYGFNDQGNSALIA